MQVGVPAIQPYPSADGLSLSPTTLWYNFSSAAGSGSGRDPERKARAIGECVERLFFSKLIAPSHILRIGEFGDDTFCESVLLALSQSVDDERRGILHDHRFMCVPAFDLFNKSVYVPWSLVALARFSNDDQFVPHTDSSGSAAHSDAGDCFQAAALEFIERQCVLLTWLGGGSSRFIDFDISDAQVRQLYEFLSSKGEVTILDISNGFSASITMALFRGNVDNPVKFVCGMGAAFDQRSSVVKSINELWVTFKYLFDSSFNKQQTNLDRLSMNGIHGNVESSADRFLSSVDRAPNYAACSQVQSLDRLIDQIREIMPATIYYSIGREIGGAFWCFGKMLSFDGFLHLDHTVGNNIENRFSKYFDLDIDACKGLPAIPFI